jgi:OFA family oxalate/formate antiporter-like MFS transporter
MTRPAGTRSTLADPSPAGRWWQLVIGVVCMSMIANLQYGWTLFVDPIDAKYQWGRKAIQWAFTLFVLTETWLVPVEGYLVDRFGPRVVVLWGGIMCAIAWAMNAFADSLTMLYAAAIVGGIGAGAVYGTCVGNALKWFPDRAGLAAGLTAAGFGAGSALTVVPIAYTIHRWGYEPAFLYFGLGQGLVVFMLAWLLRAPGPRELPARPSRTGLRGRDYQLWEMVRTPAFWVLYTMFVMVAAGGLMVTAQLGPIARDFEIADVPVSIIGLTLPALTFALTIDRVLNGLTRPFFGWVSDHLGRENTMFIAFTLEAAGIYALSQFGRDPLAFVLLSGLVFFAWGEIFSLFPATCRDTYGGRYAAANAGLLYTAKGTASLLVPLANNLTELTGNWFAVFLVASLLNATVAVCALLVLKPLRHRMLRAAADQPPPSASSASTQDAGQELKA